jgi:hypothetical protein
LPFAIGRAPQQEHILVVDSLVQAICSGILAMREIALWVTL